jgi:predicted DsbA family dithiol-disulfide isomerase
MALVITVTFYTDVTSSWCYWAEPAWADVKSKYSGQAEFRWKIALLDAKSLPISREQEEWFYRRSGTIVRSPFMLNPGWYEPGRSEYLAANVVAEAAKDLGIVDDTVRLAISHAALREGQKVSDVSAVCGIVAKACDIDAKQLERAAQNPQVEQRVRASTADFHALQVSQRPTFVLDNSIGDKAVLSGTWVAAPIMAVIDSMSADEAAYAAWAAHIGKPPLT